MAKKHTETIDSKLKTAWYVVSRMYNTEAVLHDATIAMAHFILNVDSEEGSFASDIAPQLGMESTSLSRIIQSMEDAGLIVRKSEREDKRKIRIFLTAKGKAQKELAKTAVRNFNRMIEGRIGKQRIEDFFRTVDEIVDVAEERYKSLKVEKSRKKNGMTRTA
ncbi:MAG TPA: MarR family winged helix-turn-helix transcriptional regulator [Bacteroidia bacterium]|jgi:DNA-binding MarR family transcriptional regulator|nr:MarR family winged helix-turn-helix transcriptional regulator [Bacteroidia bacterium]